MPGDAPPPLVQVAAHRRGRSGFRRGVMLGGSRAGLFVDGRLVAAHEALESAHLSLSPADGVSLIVKTNDQTTHRWFFAEREEADGILRALDLDAQLRGRTRVPFGLGVATIALSAIPMAIVFETGGNSGAALTAQLFVFGGLTVLMAVVAAAVVHTSGHVELGVDGLRIESGLRRGSHRARFVAYERIAGIRAAHTKLHVRVRDAKSVVLHFTLRAQAERAATILGDAVAAAAARGTLVGAVDVVARAASSFDELRALALGSSDRYRGATTTREELRRLVEGSAVPARVRIAAAVALKAADGAAIDAELRRIANQMADPAVERILARIARAPSEKSLRDALAAAQLAADVR